MSVGNRCHPLISYLRDRTRGLASATTRWHFNGCLSRYCRGAAQKKITSHTRNSTPSG